MTDIPTPPPRTEGGPRVTWDQVKDATTLRRPRDHRIVAGVSTGIARHLDIDPLLVRVLFGALTLFGGAGLVLYAIGWIAIPEEGAHESILSKALRREPDRVVGPALLVAAVIGVFAVLGSISFWTPNPFPAFVVVPLLIAVAIVYVARRRDAGPRPPSPTPAPTPAPTPPPTPAYPGATVAEPEPGQAVTGLRDSDTSDEASSPPGGVGGGYPPSTAYGLQPPPPARRTRSHLFASTMAVIAIALGGLWIADATGADIRPDAYPGAALAITAAALIVGAWFGRSRLLILVGLVATLATVVTATIGSGAVGQRTYRPGSAEALQDSYRIAAGQLVLRLDDVADPERLTGRTVDVHARVGQVLVVVPTSIDVSIDARTDHGDIQGLAHQEDLGNGERQVVGPTGSHALYLNLDVDFGEIVVRRVDCPTGVGPRPAPISATTLSQITLTTQGTQGGTHVPACH